MFFNSVYEIPALPVSSKWQRVEHVGVKRWDRYSKSIIQWLFLVLCCKFHRLLEQYLFSSNADITVTDSQRNVVLYKMANLFTTACAEQNQHVIINLNIKAALDKGDLNYLCTSASDNPLKGMLGGPESF